LLLPWLLVTLLQLILLGCPTVIFFSLLGTYLLLKEQFILSLVSFSAPTFLVLVAMCLWLTVLAAYWSLGAKASHSEYSKARLAQLDGYKVAVSHKPRKRAAHNGHGHAAQNVHLYPTLPLA